MNDGFQKNSQVLFAWLVGNKIAKFISMLPNLFIVKSITFKS